MSHIKKLVNRTVLISKLWNLIFWLLGLVQNNTFSKSNKSVESNWLQMSGTFVLFDALDLWPSLMWIPKLTTNHHSPPYYMKSKYLSFIILGCGKLNMLVSKQLLMVAGVIDDILSSNIYLYLYLYLWQPLLLPIWWQHPERETFPFCVFIRSHLQKTGSSIRFDTEKKRFLYKLTIQCITWYWLQSFDTIRHRYSNAESIFSEWELSQKLFEFLKQEKIVINNNLRKQMKRKWIIIN